MAVSHVMKTARHDSCCAIRDAARRYSLSEDENSQPEGDERLSEEAAIINDKLSREERDILDRFEQGELRSAPGAEQEIEAARDRLESRRRAQVFESQEELEAFFRRCDEREGPGTEPDWR